MKRILIVLAMFPCLIANAWGEPSIALTGDLYRGDERVSSFSMARVNEAGIPVQIEDTTEHGYVGGATFRDGRLVFTPASVFSGLTLNISAALLSKSTVILKVTAEVVELNGFSLKPLPGTTATAQTPRMHRSKLNTALQISGGETKYLPFGSCAQDEKSAELCTYRLAIKVSKAL